MKYSRSVVMILIFTILTLFLSIFQMTASNQVRVVLENVQISLSGTYLCEVTVTLSYFALLEYANMTVIGKSVN